MLQSLLIANRGEIACRIIRTCRRLGVRAIAVYSDADRDAQHVRLADEAWYLGPSPAPESYLRIDRILEVAGRSGAAAVHPGYGFLSENAGFARAALEAGLVFVGPPPAAMERLGGKDSAKEVMAGTGVPLVPGYHGADQSEARLIEEARRTGFPLLIKAAAGGGGRGMRVVTAAGEFTDALEACRREARGAFGDDRVLLERLIERPRHVEVQVFADRHGQAVHLFERDCTLQRRHQKIIEEAPAPLLPPGLREALGSAACDAALAAGYENAGTVEFLLGRDNGFYFIEMNTRLQVEHPVTEVITGLDLVEWQLRIAAGEPLPLRQEDIRCTGHAFEARLYAEDPAKGFLPSTGRLDVLSFPEAAEGLRVDTGVVEGDVVTSFYDPMIAKLIVHGPDRASALRGLAAALDTTRVAGPTTNLGFLRAVAAAPAFETMRIDTGWLDREGTAALATAPELTSEVLLVAALAAVSMRRQAAGTPRTPWEDAGGWRLNRAPVETVRLAAGGATHEVTIEGRGERLEAHHEGASLAGRARWADGRLVLDDGTRQIAYPAVRVRDQLVVTMKDRRFVLTLAEALTARRGEEEDEGLFTAPMPGKVTRLLVAPGDRVTKGQTLAILEAMKMESRFAAPRAGTVTAVHVAEGEQVEEGAVLLDLAAEEAEAADGG